VLRKLISLDFQSFLSFLELNLWIRGTRPWRFGECFVWWRNCVFFWLWAATFQRLCTDLHKVHTSPTRHFHLSSRTR